MYVKPLGLYWLNPKVLWICFRDNLKFRRMANEQGEEFARAVVRRIFELVESNKIAAIG